MSCLKEKHSKVSGLEGSLFLLAVHCPDAEETAVKGHSYNSSTGEEEAA